MKARILEFFSSKIEFTVYSFKIVIYWWCCVCLSILLFIFRLEEMLEIPYLCCILPVVGYYVLLFCIAFAVVIAAHKGEHDRYRIRTKDGKVFGRLEEKKLKCRCGCGEDAVDGDFAVGHDQLFELLPEKRKDDERSK